MDAAQRIRSAVARVAALRQSCQDDHVLLMGVSQIKRFQSRRFAATYADLLGAGPYCHAAQFFLDELYGERDFTERDQQFARIASAIQRIFPSEVVTTAVALAELHALTESLDHAMAHAWPHAPPDTSDALRYTLAWHEVGQAEHRASQLQGVLALGGEMDRLTRTRGLRLMLRMMRGPATAVGLNDLQRFLESGFDHFSDLARRKGQAQVFLRLIEEREHLWMARLFSADTVACATALECALGQAR